MRQTLTCVSLILDAVAKHGVHSNFKNIKRRSSFALNPMEFSSKKDESKCQSPVIRANFVTFPNNTTELM